MADVTMDKQGRVVIPRSERQRLGVSGGATFELLATPEGLILERRREASVTVAGDGLPLISLDDDAAVSNRDTLDALHEVRDAR